MHANVRAVRYIASFARQQHEHAHGFTVSARYDRRTIACRRFHDDTDANCCTNAECPPATPQRDGVVDRTAAGIQHDGRTFNVMFVGKIVESFWRVRGDDADCADPSAAVRLASHPVKPHRQLALFQARTGLNGIIEHGRHGRHCETESRGA